jgi:hypothetical protein
MAIKHYILTWLFTDELKTEIVVYGPFKTQKEAAKYGREWSKAHDDNPCWSPVNLYQEDTMEDHIRRVLVVKILPKWKISEPSQQREPESRSEPCQLSAPQQTSEPLAKREP